jgi:hypothetical protein
MDAHEDRVPQFVRDRYAFIESNKVITGACLNGSQSGSAEDSGDSLGNIQSEDFFMFPFTGSGAVVMASMPGINHDCIKKTGTDSM